jgi:hypothetical protein
MGLTIAVIPLSTERIQDNIDAEGRASADTSGNPPPVHDSINGRNQNENDDDDDDDEDEDNGVDDGPTLVQAHVQLARTPRTFI